MWRSRGAGNPGILIFWALLMLFLGYVCVCVCVFGSGGRWDFGVVAWRNCNGR